MFGLPELDSGDASDKACALIKMRTSLAVNLLIAGFTCRFSDLLGYVLTCSRSFNAWEFRKFHIHRPSPAESSRNPPNESAMSNAD